jgi:hypothetical protein
MSGVGSVARREYELLQWMGDSLSSEAMGDVGAVDYIKNVERKKERSTNCSHDSVKTEI